MDINKSHFTTKEAAELLGLHHAMVQKKVRAGGYPGYQICQRTKGFLIPREYVPIPAEFADAQGIDDLLATFIRTDILSDEEIKNISKLKRKPKLENAESI